MSEINSSLDPAWYQSIFAAQAAKLLRELHQNDKIEERVAGQSPFASRYLGHLLN